MRAYRRASTQKTVHFVRAPLNTESQRAAWIQESRIWSRALTQTIELRKQRRIEAKKEQEAQEEARNDYLVQMDDLSMNKRLWSTCCAGLAVSGVLFLILLTNLLRDTKESRLGTKSTCDSVPRVTDGSIFSVVFWIAFYVHVDSRIAAPMAAANAAALSEAVSPADAAYYRRQNEFPGLVNVAGAVLGTIVFGWDFLLTLRGKCGGGKCLNLALGTLAVMSWALLASIVGTHFLESGCRVMVGQWKRGSSVISSKKEEREEVGKSGWDLLTQDEKHTFEWV